MCHRAGCTVLDLSNHGLGIGGTAALAAVLEENDTLVEVHLGGNSVGNHGASAVARALAENSSVRMLDLSGYVLRTRLTPCTTHYRCRDAAC